ncbi:protein-export chaperone SecB [Pigmentiphaga soli]|uniref:Protein-export protein SecB n=1 Tax=Pigmentiphaga soli TaxID=1007095 RepID=A0ABP8GHX5_9BURK
MSDNQEQQQSAPVFNIQRVYLKDLSLELPNAPQIFLETEQPAVEVSIDVGAQALAETVFEVSVTATVTTKIGDKVLYLVEGKQAGIFEVANLPLEQLDPVLGIVCPGIVYPYLRANVADAITRASMAPLHLAEVNFQTIYEQRLAAAQQQQQQPEQGGDSGLILPPGARH